MQSLQELLVGLDQRLLATGLLLASQVGLFGRDGHALLSLGVRVQTEQDTNVLEGTLVLSERTLGLGLASSADHGLDLVRVDQTGDIRVGDLGDGQVVVALEGGGLVVGTEHLVEESESTLSPDDETSEVTSRGELEKVERANVGGLDTGNVAESLNDTVVLGVDDEGSTALTVLASTSLTLAGTDLLRGDDLGDVGVGVETLESGNGGLGLLDRLNRVGDDERNLRNTIDAVTTGHHERRKGGGGNGGHSSETLLVEVDLDVPLAPDLGRGEHASTTAHVTEGGLRKGSST